MGSKLGAIPGAVRSWYSEVKGGYDYNTGLSHNFLSIGTFMKLNITKQRFVVQNTFLRKMYCASSSFQKMGPRQLNRFGLFVDLPFFRFLIKKEKARQRPSFGLRYFI